MIFDFGLKVEAKSIEELMEMMNGGGGLNWKCVLGVIAVVTGSVLVATGAGLAAAGGAIGGGLGLINSNCPTKY
jgi:hypothetical protein